MNFNISTFIVQTKCDRQKFGKIGKIIVAVVHSCASAQSIRCTVLLELNRYGAKLYSCLIDTALLTLLEKIDRTRLETIDLER